MFASRRSGLSAFAVRLFAFLGVLACPVANADLIQTRNFGMVVNAACCFHEFTTQVHSFAPASSGFTGAIWELTGNLVVSFSGRNTTSESQEVRPWVDRLSLSATGTPGIQMFTNYGPDPVVCDAGALCGSSASFPIALLLFADNMVFFANSASASISLDLQPARPLCCSQARLNGTLSLTYYVPEPATMGLLGLGFAGIAFTRRRRTSDGNSPGQRS